MQVRQWQDGDMAQVAVLTDLLTINKYNKAKIGALKQNAARTGTEQAADNTHCFCIMNKLQQINTLENVDANLHYVTAKVKKN